MKVNIVSLINSNWMPYVVHVVQQSDFAQSTYANICIFQIYVQQLKTMFIPQCEPLGAESSKWVDILIQFIFDQFWLIYLRMAICVRQFRLFVSSFLETIWVLHISKGPIIIFRTKTVHLRWRYFYLRITCFELNCIETATRCNLST